MLLWLFQQLGQDIRAFNVFNYLTLRAVLATLTALTISFIVGPAVIRKLTALKIGQSVRTDGPQTHLVKSGTPTMGGALILVSVTVTTLLWADLSNHYVWVALATLVGFGVIGWVDDWRKVVEKNSRGLPRSRVSRGAAEKSACQAVVSSPSTAWAAWLSGSETAGFVPMIHTAFTSPRAIASNNSTAIRPGVWASLSVPQKRATRERDSGSKFM